MYNEYQQRNSLGYKFYPDNLFGPAKCVHRIFDDACVPFVEGNRDYQEYLKWIEEGNTPLPADE